MRPFLVGYAIALSLQTSCASGRGARLNPYAMAEIDCASAAMLLRRTSEGTPHMAPPLWRVRACPTTAGRLLAVLLDTSRAVSDTAEMEHRTWLTRYVHDAAILETALAVACDGDAHFVARIAALRTLIWMKSPGQLISLTQMVSAPTCPPKRCSSSSEGHFYRGGPMLGDTITWPVYGTPMPAMYPHLIDSIAAAVTQDVHAPQLVRHAAALVARYPPSAHLRGR